MNLGSFQNFGREAEDKILVSKPGEAKGLISMPEEAKFWPQDWGHKIEFEASVMRLRPTLWPLGRGRGQNFGIEVRWIQNFGLQPRQGHTRPNFWPWVQTKVNHLSLVFLLHQTLLLFYRVKIDLELDGLQCIWGHTAIQARRERFPPAYSTGGSTVYLFSEFWRTSCLLPALDDTYRHVLATEWCQCYLRRYLCSVFNSVCFCSIWVATHWQHCAVLVLILNMGHWTLPRILVGTSGEIVRFFTGPKKNFGCLSDFRYCAYRTQNLPGPAPNNVLTVLQLWSKSVHFRRSYSRTREVVNSVFPWGNLHCYPCRKYLFVYLHWIP